MITHEGFWRGRDRSHAAELTAEIRANAEDVIKKVNELLKRAGLERDASSGWRPAAVNAGIAGAAKRSNHTLGKAVDVADADRKLAQYARANVAVLEELGLWCEDTSYTKSWVHFQTVPPRSGRRFFIP